MEQEPEYAVNTGTGQRYCARELAQMVNQQHKIITEQDILLVVKDQEIAQLKAELLGARVQMDPYQVACEIASKAQPTNDDMRRLRAAEVAIAYCRPRLSATVSETRIVTGYAHKLELARRIADQDERERRQKQLNLKVYDGRSGGASADVAADERAAPDTDDSRGTLAPTAG